MALLSRYLAIDAWFQNDIFIAFGNYYFLRIIYYFLASRKLLPRAEKYLFLPTTALVIISP